MYVFYIDYCNDIVVNSFGFIMVVVGNKFVWYLDFVGVILIVFLIFGFWVINVFE